MANLNRATLNGDVYKFGLPKERMARKPLIACGGNYTPFFPSIPLAQFSTNRTADFCPVDEYMADSAFTEDEDEHPPTHELDDPSCGPAKIYAPLPAPYKYHSATVRDAYAFDPKTGKITNPLFSASLENSTPEKVIAFHTRVLESIKRIQKNLGPNPDTGLIERSLAYHHEERAVARGVLLPEPLYPEEA